MRDAVPSDQVAVEACVQAAYQPYIERMSTPPAPMLADYRALIERGLVSVATIDGVVCGVIVMWPEIDHFYVDNVAVDESSRGCGLGRMLLNDAERAAAAAGRQEIRLYTNAAMHENLGYYPRRGYAETHRATNSGYERVYFSRRLAPAPNPAVDNGVFRVTEYRFAPGATTGFHRHAHDYVVVPMTTGELEIVNAEGTTRASLTSGSAYTRLAGVEHDVRNPNSFEFVFVEVERLRSNRCAPAAPSSAGPRQPR
jgi:predicted N-acetyltransferase YhbS